MSDIKPMIFNLKFEREYRLNVEGYLLYCNSFKKEPSQRDYRNYCLAVICEEIENFTNVMSEATIEEREDHISSIENIR